MDPVIVNSSPRMSSLPSLLFSTLSYCISNKKRRFLGCTSTHTMTPSQTPNLLNFSHGCEIRTSVLPICSFFNSHQMCPSVFLPAYSQNYLTASLFVFAVRLSSGHLSSCLIVYCLPLSGLQLLPHKPGWDLSLCQMRVTTQNRCSWLDSDAAVHVWVRVRACACIRMVKIECMSCKDN